MDAADKAGRRAFTEGRFTDAVRHFRDALYRHPTADEEALRLLYNLGRSQQELAKGGDPAHNCEAAKWFEQQIRLAERLGLQGERRGAKAQLALVASQRRCRPPPTAADGADGAAGADEELAGALVVSVSVGGLLLKSGTVRTAVLPEVAIRLGSSDLQAVVGAAMAVEQPNAALLRPGLLGLIGPVTIGLSCPIVLLPVQTVGVRVELGLRLPLTSRVHLEIGGLGTMWPLAGRVISAEGRLGVASDF